MAENEENEEGENLRLLYRVLNDFVINRERSTLFVDSVMLPLSVGIVTYAITNRTSFGMSVIGLPVAGFIPILTLILVLFPFALHYTAIKVDDIYFNRIRRIERELGIENFGHQSIHNEFIEKRWSKLRRRIWLWFLIALMIAYILVSIWLFKDTQIINN